METCAKSCGRHELYRSSDQPRGRPVVPESPGDQRWRIGVMAGIPLWTEHFILALNYDVGLAPIVVVKMRKPNGILDGLAFAPVRFGIFAVALNLPAVPVVHDVIM